MWRSLLSLLHDIRGLSSFFLSVLCVALSWHESEPAGAEGLHHRCHVWRGCYSLLSDLYILSVFHYLEAAHWSVASGLTEADTQWTLD